MMADEDAGSTRSATVELIVRFGSRLCENVTDSRMEQFVIVQIEYLVNAALRGIPDEALY